MFDAMQAVGNGGTEADARSRMRAIAAAIIDEIQSNATIGVLSTTSTPAGQVPHIHNPLTVEATGKIS